MIGISVKDFVDRYGIEALNANQGHRVATQNADGTYDYGILAYLREGYSYQSNYNIGYVPVHYDSRHGWCHNFCESHAVKNVESKRGYFVMASKVIMISEHKNKKVKFIKKE